MTNTTCNQPAVNQTQLTEESLRHFSGDDIRYSHALNRKTIYTPGVKFVAEAGGAYWLIDAIASYYGTPVMEKAIASDYRLESLHFWRLDVNEGSAVLALRAAADCEAVIRQDIEYTDFPLDSIDIWAGFDGVRWTLYLPSEH